MIRVSEEEERFSETVSKGKIVKVYEDGRREILYHNGSIRKVIYPNNTSRTYFANGDIQDEMPDGSVSYFFHKT